MIKTIAKMLKKVWGGGGEQLYPPQLSDLSVGNKTPFLHIANFFATIFRIIFISQYAISLVILQATHFLEGVTCSPPPL